MNGHAFLKTAGIWPEHDRVGLWQWRVSVEVQPRIRRFTAFVHEVLTSAAQNIGALSASLVCLDGVSPRSLPSMNAQGVVPYLAGENVLLEWEESAPPRTERRELSRLTAALWPRGVNDSGAMACVAATDLVAGLEGFLATSMVYRSHTDRMVELERDAICWWYQCLPVPLFAHQSGLQVLSALPRSALARACTKLAAIHPQDDSQSPEVSDGDLGLTAEMIDAAHISNGSDRSPVVLQQALDLLTTLKHETDGSTKRRWAQSFFDLQARAQAAGPITSLLLAWGLDLCENGTSSVSNLARTTVQQYFRRAALPLFETLSLMPQSFDNSEWSATAMSEHYLGLMAAQSAGNAKMMASALTSFHSFLSE